MWQVVEALNSLGIYEAFVFGVGFALFLFFIYEWGKANGKTI